MSDGIKFYEISAKKKEKLQQIKNYLSSHNLGLDDDVQYFIVAKDEEGVIKACSAVADDVLKHIAVDSDLQGGSFFLDLMTRTIKLANEFGKYELSIFTKDENTVAFEACGFHKIASASHKDESVTLLQNHKNLKTYKNSLKALHVKGAKIGAVVMNCNPFTLGHQYLIEQSAQKCDHLHVIIVREDLSHFAFKDRISLVQKGTTHIKNITIHEGSEYIISRATFPTYFIKDEGNINSLHSALDLQIFKDHIAPSLGITCRYVGDEPNCAVTNEYNEQMQRILTKAPSALHVEVIPRLKNQNTPISASHVRQLLGEQKWDEVQKIVPKTTFKFLKEKP